MSNSIGGRAPERPRDTGLTDLGWGPPAGARGSQEEALLLAEMDMWTRISAGDFGRATAAAARLMIISTDAPQRGRTEAAIGVMMQRAGLMADAREQFDRALALVAGSASDEAMFLAVSSLSLVLGGDIAGAEKQARRAIAMGQEAGIGFAVRQGLTTMSAVHLANGLPQLALLDAEKAVRLATQGDAQAEYRSTAYVLLGMARAELDQLTQAHESILTGVRIAEEEGDTGQLSWYLASIALLHVIDGNWDAAISHCQTALRVARETGAVAARPLAWGVWATIEAARANSSQAETLIRQARSHRLGPFGGLGEEWVALAQAVNSRDNNERYDLLCEAWFRLRGAPFLLAWRVFAPQLVHEAVDRGDLEVARVVTATAAEGARLAPEVASAVATAQVCQGLFERDPVACQAGVDTQRTAGRPPSQALFCIDAARLWQERGEPERAGELLLEANSILRRLHATRWSALVGRMLGTGSFAPPRRTMPLAWADLTPTERHVARLAVAGRTNPEIAAELVVSPRTVQTHMAHIHAKFGVSSRVQLAADLAGFDLV